MKYLLSKDGIQFDDVEYGSFISAVSVQLCQSKEGETFYVGELIKPGSDLIFDEIRKYVVKDGNAVLIDDDYENEPRLEYENEFGEPWDFSPMDLLCLLIAWFVFFLFFYLLAVNQKW